AALHTAAWVAGIRAVLLDSPFGSGDATAAAIGLLDADENNVRFEYDGAFPAELRDRYHVAALGAPLVGLDVIKNGEPMIITDTLDLPERYQHAVPDTA